MLMERESGTKSAKQVLSNLGMEKPDFKKLQKVPWDKLLDASARVRLSPVVDGKVIPNHPFHPTAPEFSAHVPMIIGTTLEDSAMRGGSGQFDETALEKFVQETFKENANKILTAYRRVYPNASPSQGQIWTQVGSHPSSPGSQANAMALAKEIVKEILRSQDIVPCLRLENLD